MLALIGAVCFLLALLGMNLGDAGETGMMLLGLFFVALELAVGGFLPLPGRWRRTQ